MFFLLFVIDITLLFITYDAQKLSNICLIKQNNVTCNTNSACAVTSQKVHVCVCVEIEGWASGLMILLSQCLSHTQRTLHVHTHTHTCALVFICSSVPWIYVYTTCRKICAHVIPIRVYYTITYAHTRSHNFAQAHTQNICNLCAEKNRFKFRYSLVCLYVTCI